MPKETAGDDSAVSLGILPKEIVNNSPNYFNQVFKLRNLRRQGVRGTWRATMTPCDGSCESWWKDFGEAVRRLMVMKDRRRAEANQARSLSSIIPSYPNAGKQANAPRPNAPTNAQPNL